MVALDSCAGVNLGDLAFHKAMAEQFPHLVAEFKPMQEYKSCPVCQVSSLKVIEDKKKIDATCSIQHYFR